MKAVISPSNAIRKSAVLLALVFFTVSCATSTSEAPEKVVCEYANNPIVNFGSSPCLTYFEGKYYYCQSSYLKVNMRCSDKLNDLYNAEEQTILYFGKDHLISAPRLYHLNDAWYIYYSTDNGDISLREIHVLRNAAHSPLEGTWEHKAILKTGKIKSVHPSIFEHKGQLYLFTSGLEQDPDTETWSIYCSKLTNPWTISSQAYRVITPELEWECQWAIGDKEQDIHPMHILEAPICIYSKDKSKILLYYAASSPRSQYYCEGMAFCDADADITDAGSWTKLPNPVFIQEPGSNLHGTGHVSFVQGPSDDELYFVYHANEGHPILGRMNRSPYIQKWSWDENGIPALGKPCSGKTPVPSWEKKYLTSEKQ